MRLDWALCHAAPEALSAPPAPAAGITVLRADEGQATSAHIMSLQGGVEARRDGQELRADSAVYYKDSGRLRAEGNILYRKPGLVVTGESAEMELDAHTGQLDNARYQLPQRHVRGSAATMQIRNENVAVLHDVTYTTCDPGDEDWLLSSRSVRLDQSSGVGSATHVVLAFQHVPFFYFPYMTFPIDDRRKSGFLTPSFSSSSETGSEFRVPYYLNLAPRYDATLTARSLSRRGLMALGEFRYLNPASRGLLDFEYLPHDALNDTDRGLVHYLHSGRPLPRVSTEIDYSRVSDGDYFRELGNSLSTASITHLEERAEVDYTGDVWSGAARLQGFQTVDESIPAAARPYQRLPQILFDARYPERDNQLNYLINGEYVNFQRVGRVSGSRLDLEPGIALPLAARAAYFEPSLMLRQTVYALQDQSAGTDPTPDRTLPVLTVDSGVFLERDARWGAQEMLQTLEPRLFYVRIPYRDQSSLPLFDTGVPDFNFTQLFRPNRFSGADRVGDTNQLTAAVTTRFLDAATGGERLRASLGRIFYFDERQVTLGAMPSDTRGSDVVGEADAVLGRGLTAMTDLRWSTTSRKVDKAAVQLQYRPVYRSLLNLAYRFREAVLEQTDVSVLWPLGPRWHLIGRHNYSIQDSRALETLAGLEYQSCCWRVQFVKRRYVNDIGGINDTIYVQLELRGLTSIGDNIESVLEHGILGYQD